MLKLPHGQQFFMLQNKVRKLSAADPGDEICTLLSLEEKEEQTHSQGGKKGLEDVT